MSAVHCGDVVGARVVEHRVPVRELLHLAGADVQRADRVTDEQRNNGRDAALQRGSDVLQQCAGTVEGERNLLLFCQLHRKPNHRLRSGGPRTAEPSAELIFTVTQG